MREKRGIRLFAAALGLAVPLAAPAAPQEDEPTFLDTLDNEVVDVEVFVIGPDGEPVRGLRREQFELSEDGEPIEITGFYSPDGGSSPPPRQDLHLAVYFDGTALETNDRRRLLEVVGAFFELPAVSPADLILASYDGSLEVTPPGQVDSAELDRYLGALETAAGSEAEKTDGVVQSMRALGGFVEALAGMPGRKALLHLSGGLVGTTAELISLIDHANANRVTIYAVGAGPASIDGANPGRALREMAAATGGLSMTGSQGFGELLATMNRDLVGYYSLGYMPDRARRGESHPITVRVGDHGYEIRHRRHYRGRTIEEIMSGRTRSAVLLGNQQNPLDVAMEFGKSTEQEDELSVPVTVKVPLAKLVLMPQDNVHVGRIGIFVCARDSRGRTTPVQSIDLPIRIPNDRLLTALGQVADHRLTVQMPPEEHSVAISVRDEIGRLQSTVTDIWDPTAPDLPATR